MYTWLWVLVLSTLTKKKQVTSFLFYLLAKWLECSPLFWETGVQFQVESYRRLKKWYLMPPCFTHTIIKYGSRLSGQIQGEKLCSPLHLVAVAIEKGTFGSHSTMIGQITYLYIYIYICVCGWRGDDIWSDHAASFSWNLSHGQHFTFFRLFLMFHIRSGLYERLALLRILNNPKTKNSFIQPLIQKKNPKTIKQYVA